MSFIAMLSLNHGPNVDRMLLVLGRAMREALRSSFQAFVCPVTRQ
jgi:hypothetical protein